MLRISLIDQPGGAALLRLEGQLAGAWIAELEKSCEDLRAAGRRYAIDLGGVSLVDRSGFALLDRLSRHSIALRNGSPFQEEQLRQIALSKENHS